MFGLIMDFYDPDFYNVKQGRVILRCITLIIRRHSAFFLTFFISLVFLIMYCLYIVVYDINWRSIIFDFGTHDSPVSVKLRMFISISICNSEKCLRITTIHHYFSDHWRLISSLHFLLWFLNIFTLFHDPLHQDV